MASAAILLVAAAALACRGEEAPAVSAYAATELSAGAQTDGLVSDGESARRIAAHRLTRERVERWFTAQEHLDALVAEEPALEYRIRGPGGRSERGDERAIRQAVSRLEEEPAVREAITRAGLSVSEFVLTGLALHQALLASGPAAPAALRRLAERNARFVTANAELLQRYAEQTPRYLSAEAPRPDTLFYDYMSGVDTIVYEVGGAEPMAPEDSLADTLRLRDTLAALDSVLRPLPDFPAGGRGDSASGAPRRDSLPVRPASDSAALRALDSLRVRTPPVRVPPVLPPGGTPPASQEPGAAAAGR